VSDTPNLILVSSEAPALLLELLGKARQIADPLGWRVAAFPLDPDLALETAALGEAGADLVYRAGGEVPLDGNPENSLALLTAAILQDQPRLVLVGATKLGMEIAPRAAERVSGGYGAWAAAVEIVPGPCQVTAQCTLYTGLGLATYRFQACTTLLTVAQGVFKRQEGNGRVAEAVSITAPKFEPRLKVVGYSPKPGSSTRIEEARAVVDLGQGVKQREDLALIQSIAALLDAHLACTRPIAADRDWFPEWLGLSGKKVSAELCLTVGTSGAIQHVIGIRDSRVIVAVNNDENAGIFSQVDYGVVADLYAFLPALAERIRARGVRPIWAA
jgi:electron transfer flavoprotein alpha subunit